MLIYIMVSLKTLLRLAGCCVLKPLNALVVLVSYHIESKNMWKNDNSSCYDLFTHQKSDPIDLFIVYCLILKDSLWIRLWLMRS